MSFKPPILLSNILSRMPRRPLNLGTSSMVVGLSNFFSFLWRKRQNEVASLKMVASLMLSPREKVWVIELGESWLVLGSGANGLTTLSQLHKGGLPLTLRLSDMPLPLESALQGQNQKPVERNSTIAEQIAAPAPPAVAREEIVELSQAAFPSASQLAAIEAPQQNVVPVDVAVAPTSPVETAEQLVEKFSSIRAEAERIDAAKQVGADEYGFPDPSLAVAAEFVEMKRIASDTTPEQEKSAVPAAMKESFREIYDGVKNAIH